MESSSPKTGGVDLQTRAGITVNAEECAASRNHGAWLLSAGMAGIFLYLLYRNLGLYPVVMADEWAYSLYSRLLPFSRSSIPSYLFFWLFKQTNHSGGGYLDCARLFNCILFVGSAPFIYAVSRQVVQPITAAFIALLALVGPVNTYTAYFMPESMYFFGFWVLSWLVLTFRRQRPLLYGCAIGATLACLLMVKVHALFLMPGVAAAIIASIACSKAPSRWSRAVLIFVYAGLTTIAVRFLAGYLFAGTAGLHILGQKYGAAADSSLTVNALLRMTAQGLFVLKGHVLGLILLYGVPLASLAVWQRRQNRSPQADKLFVIKVYTLSTLAFLLVVTAYYTVSVVGQPHEAIDRLHLRYYNFALPLLFIVAAGEWATARRSKLYVTLPVGVAVGGLALYSLWALRKQYAPNAIDSPELQAAFFNIGVLHMIAGLGIAALAVWVLNRRRGAGLFLFVVLPVTLLSLANFANAGLRRHLYPDVYESAGQAVHSTLSRQERSKLAVVGADEVELYKSLFQIDSAEATMVIVPEGATLEMSALPAQDDWVLVVGEHAAPKELELELPRSGYALYRRQHSMELRDPLPTDQ